MSLMSFIQGRTIHGLGEYRAFQAVKHFSQGILGKLEFYRVLEEATWKQSRIGQEVRNFLIRPADRIFQSKVSQLKLGWRTVVSVCQVSLTDVSCKSRLSQVQICDMSWATRAVSILWVSTYKLTLLEAKKVTFLATESDSNGDSTVTLINSYISSEAFIW